MLGPTRVVVLDDDPTGTQAAADVTVLLDHDVQALVDVLSTDRSVYVQMNSRALVESEAVCLARSIRASAEEAGRRLGVDIRFVLRGDSTLRGHVFAESAVFAQDDAVMIFVPAFPEGGRVTRDGVHYVRQRNSLLPVGETEFSRDPVFGFASSALADFVAERTDAPTITVPLVAVRSGGLADVLREAPAGAVVLPDAVESSDIAAIARAAQSVWGWRPLVVRSAAPLAAELAGVPSGGLLHPSILAGAHSVLVVCGSHTDIARTQIARLAEDVGEPTEVSTIAALADPAVEGARVAAEEVRRQRPSRVRFVATERTRSDAHATLSDGAAVMNALTTATRLLAGDTDAVVTKGGITAAEVMSRGLGAQRARVLGQLHPGVSLWRVSAAAGREVPVVIVPGNMGDDDILVEAVGWLESANMRGN